MTRFFKETKCAYVGGGRIDYIILIGLLWFLGVPGTRWLEYRVHLLIEHTLVEFNRQSIGVIKQYPCIVQKSWKIFIGEVQTFGKKPFVTKFCEKNVNILLIF